MRIFSFLFVLLLGMSGRAQVDTVYMTPWDLADTIYGQLEQNVSTGLLLNRLMTDTSQTYVNRANRFNEYIPRADHYYRLMEELKLMAYDSSQITGQYELYLSASSYVGQKEFSEDKNVYPIGIADFEYSYLDEAYAFSNGLLSQSGYSLVAANPSISGAFQINKVQLIAPLYDYFVSDDIFLVFRQNDFRSNYRDVNEIASIEILRHGSWTTLAFDEEYNLTVDFLPTQEFAVRVSYYNGDQIYNNCIIHTPELENASAKAAFTHCKRDEKMWIGTTALRYCLIPGCLNPTRDEEGEDVKPNKPFILVTGYRPPIFGQSFETTWRNYHEEHANLLGQILDKGFDVYLVKFNIQENPQGHGMLESADLFRKFLEDVNYEKLDKANENIVQGSSMGSDIVRLAILQMEYEHFNNNSYPHHHTRLFIHYDPNLWGANIPLAYQYQIVSGLLMPQFASPEPILDGIFNLLKTDLYATVQQRTVKQLLRYHALANLSVPFTSPLSINNIEPDMHPLRYEFYAALNDVNNFQYITPLPCSTRHIAISLGKISGTNDINPENNTYNAAGEYWRNDVFPGIQKLRTAIYSDDYTDFFRRQKMLYTPPYYTFGIPFPIGMVHHEVNVKRMQEIDNASGSFLGGVGNLIDVTNKAYFDPLLTGLASHKSVVTALGIHPDYWPADGSMTLNIQDLGLMFEGHDITGAQILSNHYGYPNLGRPNDHFSVTPFEAIYVDEQIDPHIRLYDSEHLAELNAFIFNEVEPWYLGLQNEEVGTQARPNYLYQRKLQALYEISVGHTVTPRTDPGNYNVHPNVSMQLLAGNSIDLYPGTEFMAGCEVDLGIDFEVCSSPWSGGGKSPETGGLGDPNVDAYRQTSEDFAQTRLYPNPSDGSSSLISMSSFPIESLEIFDFYGNLIYSIGEVGRTRFDIPIRPAHGTYVVLVGCQGKVERLKWVVL